MKDPYFEDYVHGEDKIVNIEITAAEDVNEERLVVTYYKDSITDRKLLYLDNYFLIKVPCYKHLYSKTAEDLIENLKSVSLENNKELKDIDLEYYSSASEDIDYSCVIASWDVIPRKEQIVERERVYNELKELAIKMKEEKEHQLFLKLKEKYEPSNFPPVND